MGAPQRCAAVTVGSLVAYRRDLGAPSVSGTAADGLLGDLVRPTCRRPLRLADGRPPHRISSVSVPPMLS
jgi:hypothetical protein